MKKYNVSLSLFETKHKVLDVVFRFYSFVFLSDIHTSSLWQPCFLFVITYRTHSVYVTKCQKHNNWHYKIPFQYKNALCCFFISFLDTLVRRTIAKMNCNMITVHNNMTWYIKSSPNILIEIDKKSFGRVIVYALCPSTKP